MPVATDDAFFDVPRNTFSTSQGEVELPILYYDVSLVQGLFWCDPERVDAVLAGSDLRPTVFFNGRALAGVAFYEYRDNTIGPYNETGVAVAVELEARPPARLPLLQLLRDPRRRSMGFHILDLPVTTEEACAAGRELWGYPKFVTEIPFRLGDGDFDCSVTEPGTGEALVAFRGPVGRGPRLPLFSLLLYSHHQDTLLRTVVDVRARGTTGLGRDTRLEVSDSDHRMARNLRDLGLRGARPFMVATTDRFQSILHAGTRLADA